MGAGIDRVCSWAVVRGLADAASLARGAVYAGQGRVERLAGSTERVTATVPGSMPYAVELRADGDTLAWPCSCPAGEDGTFCKHCVAVALTLDREGPDALFDPDDEDEDDVGADLERDRLVEYVERLDHERLVALVVAAKDNRGYRAAVELLERMRRCYAALGRDDDFAAHLAGVRAEHGRKRNLMKLFAERGW